MNAATEAARIDWTNTQPWECPDFFNDDDQERTDLSGRLLAEAIRIVEGDSDDLPTLDHLRALVDENRALLALLAEADRLTAYGTGGTCPF